MIVDAAIIRNPGTGESMMVCRDCLAQMELGVWLIDAIKPSPNGNTVQRCGGCQKRLKVVE